MELESNRPKNHHAASASEKDDEPEENNTVPISSDDNDEPSCFLTGWRLHCTTLGIVLSFLLVNLEVTIVATSLVAITDDLGDFDKTTWIVSGYLTAYMGFMIVWGKLSDIFGRKTTYIFSMAFFTVWSAGCGASQTMTQLIICRTFQGIGGAGGNSIGTVMTYEFVPKHKLGLYGGFNSVAVALATLMGPLFGGLINDHTTWRWVFYLNLPAGAFAMATLALGIPNGFPYHNRNDPSSQMQREPISVKSVRRIDFLGVAMLLASSLMLSAVLLEVSIRWGWSDVKSIVLLTLSIICWPVFFAWEWYVSMGKTKQEPLFPWAFVLDRPWMGILISSFLCGVPFNVVVVFLPQRLQTVSGVSPLDAGVRLLPYTFGAAFGSVLAMAMGSKRRVAVVNVLILGATLQTVGLALLSTLPTTSEWPDRGFGYATIAGVGMGMSFGIGVLATPFVVDQKYIAVAGGALIQFRFLGGVIGLAIATNVFNSRLMDRLRQLLKPEVIAALHQDAKIIETLPTALKAQVISVFAKEYNYQDKILIAFAGAQLLSAAMVWNRKWSKIG